MTQTWQELYKNFTIEKLMTPRNEWSTISNQDRTIICPEKEFLDFDLVPVESNGEIVGMILNGNCEEVVPITKDWLITQDTPIRDLISIFAKNSKPALLVVYKQEFVGIISPADLNKIQARTFIYLLLGQLEMMIGQIIQQTDLTDDEIISCLAEDKQANLKESMNKLENTNLDIDIVQRLYLVDLKLIIIKNKFLLEKFSFVSKTKAEESFSGLNCLRNKIMHPVNPVIDNKGGVAKLERRIARIESLVEKSNSIIQSDKSQKN